MLRALGVRVRARREGAGLTRRELAERAEVSERFLASVETGEGNVSVARLCDLAAALECEPAELLAELGAKRGAPAGGRRVLALLGLRGAGKSTLGAQLARSLEVEFVELDAWVEQRAAMSLRELFELHGVAYYRRLEREALGALLERRESAVVATGGGLVTDGATWELLRRRACTVWLRARPEEHLARVVAQGDARPMAGHADALADLRKLLSARAPLYERAEHTVDTSALGPVKSLRALLRIAREAGLRAGA